MAHSQSEYIQAAKFYEGFCWSSDELPGQPAEAFQWAFEECRLSLIGFTAEDIEFLIVDEKERTAERGGEAFPADWWKEPQDYTDAITLVEINGKAYVWDGNHRAAFALNAGVESVPVLIGRAR